MKPAPRSVVVWLGVVCTMILAMIVLGGVTRLTESGLSITQWEPILGAIPPHTDAQWQERFEMYKAATGQAKIMFPKLTVEEFKPLFLWEYFHRLTGRLLGVVFLIPFLVFLAKRKIEKRLAIKLVAAFACGGLQGGIGWLMVKTGLQQDATHVSHYSLAAHLCAALALLGYLFWQLLNLLPPRESAAARFAPRWIRRAAFAYIAALAVQIIYGAFTAGLRAGHFHNTFPKMTGFWIPPGTFGASPINDLLTNPQAIQWIHRLLAWILGFGALIFWPVARRAAPAPRQKTELDLLAALTLAQFGLGVAVILLNVPVWLGALHQLNAALLLCSALALVHSLRRARKTDADSQRVEKFSA